MTCCIYARVSTADQHCDLQLTELRAWAARHEWVVVAEYLDIMSGGRTDRPQLAKMMKDAEAKRFDIVLVYKLDRLGRSVSHLDQLVKDFERFGIRFLATSQGIDTDHSNPTSRLLLHILGAVAEFERELTKERTVLGVQNAMKLGEGSLRANGTKRKKVGKPPAIFNRTHALELRETGMSWRSIAGELHIPYSTLRQNMPAENEAAVIANGRES